MTVAAEQWVLSQALAEFAADGEFDLVREIIDVFLKDSEVKVDSLQDAIRRSDLAGVRRISHSLKGAARQMGLPRLAEIAERLENGSAAMETTALVFVERWRQAKQSVISTRDSILAPRD